MLVVTAFWIDYPWERMRKVRTVDEGLPAREDIFRHLFLGSPLGIVMTDWDLRILRVNPAFARMLGYAEEELVGRSVDEITDPDDRATARQLVGRLRRGELPQVQYEKRYRRKDGQVVHGRVTALIIFDDHRDPLYGLGLVEDVTESKRVAAALEESNHRLREIIGQLQQSQQQVIRQERLRAFGEMAGEIAHDFNNALSQILGYVSLLLEIHPEDLRDPAKVGAYLAAMQMAAEDAASIVRRLGTFYRQPAPAGFSPLDLNAVIRQAVALTEPRWRYAPSSTGTTIRVQTPLGAIPSVIGDGAQLREVFTNLIFNAVEALPRGGIIEIRTRHEEGWVIAQVVDTGVGMDEETRQRCLEPFFTTKGERGSGLGLSIAREILQRHQGSIEVASQVGQGTVFTIRLPGANHRQDDGDLSGGTSAHVPA